MLFEKYRSALLAANDVHTSSLLIDQEGALTVHYAPFDHVNLGARIVVMGITPGEVQANAAIRTANAALRNGLSGAEAIRLAKETASFSGPMRSNLIAILDHIGINKALGIASTASLWTTDAHLVQFASALRYPVFKAGKNYTGSSPTITGAPLLRKQLVTYTGPELAHIPNALVIPLGPSVAAACRWLTTEGFLSSERIIEGLPHPSGANAERIAYFLNRKERSALSRKTDPASIETNRQLALAKVQAWSCTFPNFT